MEKNWYQYVGYIIDPDIESQKETLGDCYDEVKHDFDFVINENNPFNARVETMQCYLFEDGAMLQTEGNTDYLIEQDGDGVYLYKRITSPESREREMRIEKFGFLEWFNQYAPLGWKMAVAQEGKTDNRAYNVFDENDELVGSYDEVDGWCEGSAYFSDDMEIIGIFKK